MNNKVICTLFSHEASAEKAIRVLKRKGYTENSLTILAKDKNRIKRIEENTQSIGIATKEGRDYRTGLGTSRGYISGGPAGAMGIVIAEFGLIIARYIKGVVKNDSTSTALINRGVPEEDAEHYEQYLKDDKIIVMVEVFE